MSSHLLQIHQYLPFLAVVVCGEHTSLIFVMGIYYIRNTVSFFLAIEKLHHHRRFLPMETRFQNFLKVHGLRSNCNWLSLGYIHISYLSKVVDSQFFCEQRLVYRRSREREGRFKKHLDIHITYIIYINIFYQHLKTPSCWHHLISTKSVFWGEIQLRTWGETHKRTSCGYNSSTGFLFTNFRGQGPPKTSVYEKCVEWGVLNYWIGKLVRENRLRIYTKLPRIIQDCIKI